jgi:acetyl-CoA carboxylase biotin carboxyl carrier protein
MDFKKLKEFISIAKEAGAAELEYEDGDKKFAVAFPYANSAPAQAVHYAAPVAAVTTSAAPASAGASKNAGLLEVTSPFVGTFYRSANPEAPAYAKAGDRVNKGQVLCIVEAMKIMNEIESEFAGEIVEVCVENETFVEFGQVLFRVKP